MAATAPRKDPKADPWTVLSVLRWTTGRFEERGLATPRLDAEILIAAALRVTRVQLYVQFDRPLSSEELAAIRAHVQRRQGGESVAYIVGHKEFFGLDFAVDARVLVPRPDTETLVDEALGRLRARARASGPAESEVEGASNATGLTAAEPDPAPTSGDATTATAAEILHETRAAAAPPTAAANPGETELGPGRGLKIADIGTGSGAIVVTLGKQLPEAALFAVDLSPEALEVARANAARHGVTVTFRQGDLAAPLAADGPFDLIAANLPYVPSADLAGLAPEVRGEPRGALDGGPDGLALVRRLIADAPGLLAPGGALVLEIGAGQAERVAALCREAGLEDVQLRRDLGTIDRVVSAVKP